MLGFDKFIQTIKSLCSKEPELDEFIRIDKLKQDAIDSTANINSILNTNKLFSNYLNFNSFTASVFNMLPSTSVACPHLSICLVQLWYQPLSSLVSSLIKRNSECSIILQYNINREIFIKFIESIMLGFKRIAVTKSFEITQIKVMIKCMIRIIRLKSDIIDYDEQYHESTFQNCLLDDYIYCSNMVFWVCMSCIQTCFASSNNKSAKSIVEIGLKSLIMLLNEKRFKEFLCDTKRFTKNFENYSVFSVERKEAKTSTFSSSLELDGHYVCFYDTLFECLNYREFVSDIETLLSFDIADHTFCSYDRNENLFLRFVIMILISTTKISEVYESNDTPSKSKLSSIDKILNNIRRYLPYIEDGLQEDIEESLNALEGLVSKTNSKSSLSINNIFERFHQLVMSTIQYLCSNGNQFAASRIVDQTEKFVKVFKLSHPFYEELISSLKDDQIFLIRKVSNFKKDEFNSDSIPESFEEDEKCEDDATPTDFSPAIKYSESPIITKFKEFYNKSMILGEKLSQIPSIIVPSYFGVRKIFIQEHTKTEKQKDTLRFSNQGAIFSKLTYKDYFCEKEADLDLNPFATASEDFANEDVEELFKSTQKFIENSSKIGKLKKRKSYLIQMSANKHSINSKNTSLESPLSKDSSIGIRLPDMYSKKRKTNIMKLQKFGSSNEPLELGSGDINFVRTAADNITRQSLGTETLNQDFFSMIKSSLKGNKKYK